MVEKLIKFLIIHFLDKNNDLRVWSINRDERVGYDIVKATYNGYGSLTTRSVRNYMLEKHRTCRSCAFSQWNGGNDGYKCSRREWGGDEFLKMSGDYCSCFRPKEEQLCR